MNHVDGLRNHARRTSCVAVVLGMICTAGVDCPQAADNAPGDNSERERLVEILGDYAARHRLVDDSADDEPFDLRPEPLITWTNPTRSRHFGGIYIWTQDNRPSAFCGIYVKDEGGKVSVSREYHSLATAPFAAIFDGKPVWAPEQPGVEFHPVAGATRPAQTAAVRLRQMKAIASQVSIAISLRDTPPEPLRMLPRPIFRYSDPETGLSDGAIIAFVQGTDPEALLLIEARSDENEARWHYGIARCTSWGLAAQIGGKTVYEVPPYYGSGNHTSTSIFFCIHQKPLE